MLPPKRKSPRRWLYRTALMLVVAIGLYLWIAWLRRLLLATSSSANVDSFAKSKPPVTIEAEKEANLPIPMETAPPVTKRIEPLPTKRVGGDVNDDDDTTILAAYADEDCATEPFREFHLEIAHGSEEEYTESKFSAHVVVDMGETNAHGVDILSLRVRGLGHAEFFHYELFLYGMHHSDECVRVFSYPRANKVRLFPHTPLMERAQIPQASLETLRRKVRNNREKEHPEEAGDGDATLRNAAKYRVVYSAESAEYFGYQMWANMYGFLHSNQGDATWTRLLTCQSPDDLSRDPRFPTFTAQRHAYSARYSPLNKPDVLTKWFASKDAPKEDVIVVIDPDSWLLRSMEPFVDRVRPGQAVGQVAYYYGSRTAQRLWRELCEANCDRDMDLVGVPYIVHRDDMRAIAPLWRHYVLKIKYNMEPSTPGSAEFSNKYRHLDVSWAAEMFGYNMAATHLGVAHEVVRELQVRDVDGERTFEQCKDKVSLHMGRAWFPRGHPAAKKWLHTEGRNFAMYGDQVWCKCNFTASTVQPWPLVDGMDFMSYHTLRMMHEANEEFGPVPENEEWRHKKKDLREGYHWSHP